jgi:hypothetical protein
MSGTEIRVPRKECQTRRGTANQNQKRREKGKEQGEQNRKKKRKKKEKENQFGEDRGTPII